MTKKGAEFVERITLRCVGYIDHRVVRFAPKCRREIRRTLAKLDEVERRRGRRSRSTYSERNPGFYDVPSREFRCDRCVAAARVIAIREARIAEITPERIQSRTQRIEIQRDLWQEISPGFGYEAVRHHVANGHSTKASILRWWSLRAGVPNKPQVFTCYGCGDLTITTKTPAEWHNQCLWDWRKTLRGRAYVSAVRRGMRPKVQDFLSRRAGKPKTADTLKRHFQWALLNKLGGVSATEIAREAGVSHVAVVKAVAAIMASLPAPELVRKEFQPHITLLRGARGD